MKKTTISNGKSNHFLQKDFRIKFQNVKTESISNFPEKVILSAIMGK